MIITKLNGGLGNQMFQYALGRALALKHKTELFADIRSYSNQPYTDTKRIYELDKFDTAIRIADKNIVRQFANPEFLKKFLNRLHLKLNPYQERYIQEKSPSFQPSVLQAPDNIYLSGFWQSEKYFSHIKDVIRRDFASRKHPASLSNRLLMKEIKKENSISIHVRRTDYVTNKKTHAFHGTLPITYYERAIDNIRSKVKNASYYVFSDDPDWAKENIRLTNHTVYVSHNRGRDAHEDLRLMSMCQHNIIANSSFSWWGAWLNKNPDKIVIAPKKWFNNSSAHNPDLLPANWRQM